MIIKPFLVRLQAGNFLSAFFRRSTRHFRAVWLGAALLTGFTGANAFAAFDSGIIGFDYTLLNLPYGPGPGAIGSAGDHWNSNDLTNVNTFRSLFRTDGSATTVGWTISSGGGQSGSTLGTYGGLFDTEASFYSASITGLTPNKQYSLYLYAGINWFDSLTVNGINYFTPGVSQTIPVNSLVAGTHYDVHTVTSDSLGRLLFVPIGAGGPNSAYISSWQLTAVPEPGTACLTGLALAGFMVRRLASRRKN